MHYDANDERRIKESYMSLNRKYPNWNCQPIYSGYIHYKGDYIHYRNYATSRSYIFERTGGYPCFILDITGDETLLISVNDMLDESIRTKRLIRIAIEIARKQGVTSISLVDNATILCPERVDLADLSFLTTGKTMYESVIPWMVPENQMDLAENRNRVLTNTWSSVYAALRADPYITENYVFDTDGIDTTAPGSAMAVLDRARRSKRHGAFFQKYTWNLKKASHVWGMWGLEWTIPLTPMANRRFTQKAPPLRIKRKKTNESPGLQISPMKNMNYYAGVERDIIMAYALVGGMNPHIFRRQISFGHVYYKGHYIHYRVYENCRTFFFERAREYPCFILDITDGKAMLISVKDILDDSINTKRMARIAIEIARKQGVTSISLVDNATILCPERVSLANLAILTTGKTWYESVIPWMVPEKPIELVENRGRALTNTWSSVHDALCVDSYVTENYEFDTDGIDTTAPGSAMAVLDRAKRSKRHGAFFQKYMWNLMKASRMTELRGVEWIIPLPPTSNKPVKRITRKRRH